MDVLVTGSDGFVGRHLVELLKKRGDVISFFDLGRGHDVRSYEQLRRAVETAEPDRIFHLAAQAYVPESSTDTRRGFAVNVGGTLNLLEAVRHTGSRARVLLAGTSEEYGYDRDDEVLTEESPTWPTTPYGVTKLAAGHLGLAYSRQYGLDVVVTRAWNHTGPGHAPTYAVSSFARKVALVLAGRADRVTHGNLEAVRSYADVRDVVRAYVEAVELPSGVYNVAGDTPPVAMHHVLDTLVRVAGVEIETSLDPTLYRPGMSRGEARFPRPSHELLTRLTGWRPEYTLEQTLRDTLDYWRELV